MADGKKKHKWVKAATKHKGLLHKHLGIPEGEKIPDEKLHHAMRSKDETIRKEAELAMTMRGFKHKKKGKSTEEIMKSRYGSK